MPNIGPKIIPRNKEVWSAMVVDIPDDTAFSVWFEKLTSEIENYKFKTFSTREAALLWLKKSTFYND